MARGGFRDARRRIRDSPGRPSSVLARHGRRFFVGLAGLCRTEWGIGALVAVLLGVGARHSFRASARRALLILLVTALATFGAVIGAFVWFAGEGPVLRESLVLLTGIPPEVRKWLIDASGVRDWQRGTLSILHSTAFCLALYWITEILALRRTAPDRARRRLPWLLASLGVLVAGALLDTPMGSILFSWSPLVCAAALVVGLRQGRRGASLVSFAVMGLIFSARRVFDLRDFGYAAPPPFSTAPSSAAAAKSEPVFISMMRR